MSRLARQFSPLNLSVAVLLLLLAVGGFWWRQRQFDPAPLPPQRPSPETVLVYDYAGILQDDVASADRSLRALYRRYGIEMVIVTVDTLPDDMTIGALARTLIERWQIGGNGEGGMLLLTAQKENLVKLQVGTRLADVFSDTFCRQAEERLWRPHFSRGEPAKALTAVLEAVENRAREKKPPPAQRADGGLGTDVLGGQSE